MALFGQDDKVVVPEKKTPITTEYKQDTATVYENLEQPVRVSATLEGSPWPVTLINQVLRQDDTPRRLDLGLDPSLQQYIQINDFIIGVTDSLTPSKDGTTGITRVTGGGQTYPGVILNVGDMFIGKQKDNRLGLFEIKTVERLQYIAGSAFEITYQLHDYMSTLYERDINRNVIHTYHFDESRVACGDPLVSESFIKDIGMTLKDMVNWYYDLFYDLESETFLWSYKPSNGDIEKNVYDHFCVQFMRGILDYDLRGLNPEARVYSCLNGEYRDNSITVWDTLMTGNPRTLDLIKTKAGLLSPELFHTERMYNSIALSPIEHVMWPGGHATLLNRSSEDDGEDYVFSHNFYAQNKTDMSSLESAVIESINKRPISGELVNDLIVGLKGKTNHQLYHLIPVMIWLLKSQTR